MTPPRVEGRPWTADEDAIILAHRAGQSWQTEAALLPGRSPSACLNRHQRLRSGVAPVLPPNGQARFTPADEHASIRQSTRLLGEAIERYLAKRRAA